MEGAAALLVRLVGIATAVQQALQTAAVVTLQGLRGGRRWGRGVRGRERRGKGDRGDREGRQGGGKKEKEGEERGAVLMNLQY